MMRRSIDATCAAKAIAFLAAFCSSLGAIAQPRPKQATGSMVARVSGASAISYMSGKQPLVGLHAPSERPVPRDQAGRPMLSLNTVNRGEFLAVPASSDEGGFASTDLDRIAHLLRAAAGEEIPIDARELSLVYRIEVHFGVPEVKVVSGYRVPRAGSHSNHGKGRAMDIIVPGVPDEEVARFAREIGFVGVGVYPTSQFVHVDVRPHSYFWVDYSGPHMRNRERGILGDLAAKSDAAAVARGQAPIEPFVIATNVDAALQARAMTAIATGAAEEDEDEEN
jgi:uncharacterized protein YcbK (DUF882 family)